MTALLLASLLSLPIWPVNPVRQDTAAFLNSQIAVGMTAPNGVSGVAGDLSAKLEMLLVHPFFLQGAVDYRFGPTMAIRLPGGAVYGPTWAVEAVYYRGTNRMTGIVGLGPVLFTGGYNLNGRSADSLLSNHGITGVRIRPAPGYRITFGLRVRRALAIEVSLTTVHPTFVFTERLDSSRYTEISRKEQFNDFRFSIGYLFELKRFEH